MSSVLPVNLAIWPWSFHTGRYCDQGWSNPLCGNVLKAVPSLVRGGNKQFAGHAVSQWLQCILVHDLRQEMVLMDMESLMELAVCGNARSHDFAEAVDIVGVDSPADAQSGFSFSQSRALLR